MNRKSKIIVSVVGITIVALALLGITYAYYLTRIEGNTNTNSISVTTADLKLKYNDGNGLLTATNIMPGKQIEFKTADNQTTTEKTFTVTNTGNSTIDGYAVSLDYVYIEDVMPSIYERPEDFQISLTCTTNKTGETCNGFIGNFNNESIMLVLNSIEQNEVHTYSLSIYYKDPGIDQSNDMGKNLNLKVQIYNIGETADIEGAITGVDSNHSVRLESEPKISTIVDGKYGFKGVEVGTHTLTVLDKDGNEVDKEYIIVKSGTTSSIIETKTTINNIEVDATEITITKEERVFNLETSVEKGVLTIDKTTSSIEIFNPYSNNKNSLVYQIINNAISAKLNNSSTNTIYNTTPLTKPAQAISTENEKVLSLATDDYGTSYYYRGNVTDNYVTFNGMCWRIVRIQGDGSVKLILANKNGVCSDNNNDGIIDNKTDDSYYIATGAYEYGDGIQDFDNSYIFLNGGTLEWAVSVDNDSGFVLVEKDYTVWPSSTLGKLKREKWCLGNVTNRYDWETDLLLKENEESGEMGDYYEVWKRLKGHNSQSYATLECGENSLYYEDVIGTLTADEVAFAGAVMPDYTQENFEDLNNTTYYLEHEKSNYNTWFTLSYSYGYGSECPGVTSVYHGELFDDSAMEALYNETRPVVVLDKKNTVSSGNGTLKNPYVIE